MYESSPTIFFPRLKVQRGPSETSVRNTEVVYVSGNDLVIKLEDGRVEHMVVADMAAK